MDAGTLNPRSDEGIFSFSPWCGLRPPIRRPSLGKRKSVEEFVLNFQLPPSHKYGKRSYKIQDLSLQKKTFYRYCTHLYYITVRQYSSALLSGISKSFCFATNMSRIFMERRAYIASLTLQVLYLIGQIGEVRICT